MTKPFVLVSAPVATRSGYGSHARDLVHSLIDMDKYDIKVISTRWGNTPMNALDYQNEKDRKIVDLLVRAQLDRQPDIFIQVTVPNEFQAVGKYNIGITAGIETTAAPSDWIEGVNRMNLIIVPSNHSKEVLVNTKYTKMDANTKHAIGELKVDRPIDILFEGVDTEQYGVDKDGNPVSGFEKTVDELLAQIPEDFCFLFVGHWLPGDLGHDRKNVGMLVKTFYTVFQSHPNPPALVLKTNEVDFSVIDRESILNRIRTIRETFTDQDSLPNVYLIHGDLSASELNTLYTHPKTKCHISFTRGEGFGRPLLEASLSGKPIIAPNWSGHVDFLDDERTILLPGSMERVHKSAANKFILEDSTWFTVHYSQAAMKMNEVFNDYDKFAPKAKDLARINRNMFSLNHMTSLFQEILESRIKLPEEIKIQLPKLLQVENLKKLHEAKKEADKKDARQEE